MCSVKKGNQGHLIEPWKSTTEIWGVTSLPLIHDRCPLQRPINSFHYYNFNLPRRCIMSMETRDYSFPHSGTLKVETWYIITSDSLVQFWLILICFCGLSFSNSQYRWSRHDFLTEEKDPSLWSQLAPYLKLLRNFKLDSITVVSESETTKIAWITGQSPIYLDSRISNSRLQESAVRQAAQWRGF